ncbi:MAG: AAA family ATPase [Pseudonocardiaceae bacterium]
MQLLTFEDLVSLAEERRASARAPEKVAGWDRLLSVARDLAGSSASDDDVARGRTWSLIRVRIHSYQGVGAKPLEIQFDPTPGVTVMHGQNGSGKSSIADAIATALHGEPRQPAAPGSGGNAPLWERDHCGRDANEAFVEVTLRCGAEQLVLSCRIDQDGRVTKRKVQHDTEPVTTELDLSTTTWRSALAAVTNAGAPAAEAMRRWRGALASAQAAVVAVDQQRAPSGASDLVWPDIDDDPNQWLQTSELTEAGSSVPEVTEQHHDRLQGAVGDVIQALLDLEAAETSLASRLAGPLKDLHERAEALVDPGETCPVCATAGIPWVPRLGTTVTGLVAIEAEDGVFRERLSELRRVLDTDVSQVTEVLRQDWCDVAASAAAKPAIERCSELLKVLDHDGQQATPRVRAAVRAACDSLMSEDWRAVMLDAARQSDHRRQWLRARRAAVDPFVDCWRACATEGAAALSWQSADKCLSDLHTQLRTQRAENLQVSTNSAVQQLLHDVGFSVTSLSVQGTKASVDVTDGSGKSVRLSMLSAGQRNALLLAPLLAVAHGGPFGFLVLDDPVHAFDQVRVDHLARLIHDLAARRRVIVLTHDERLKEHLLARSAACEARSVKRDPITGDVSEEVTASMWRILVDDARAALQLAKSQPGATCVNRARFPAVSRHLADKCPADG